MIPCKIGFVTSASVPTSNLKIVSIIMWIPTHTYRSRPGKKYGPLRTNRPYSAWLLKAFDKVPHERLLCKAQYYGIDGSTLLWIRDFLSSRIQRVLVEGLFSGSLHWSKLSISSWSDCMSDALWILLYSTQSSANSLTLHDLM
jgi:hypothetical protein